VEVVGGVVVAHLVAIINKMKKQILIGIGILVIIVIAFISFNKGFTGKIISEGDVIEIPLSEISEKAKFYESDEIKFFAIKASDGTIKTAFDACDVCYSSHKGYRQEGNYMVCNNCGNKYPISGLGAENLRGGGCWPGYLPSSVEGDQIVIKVTDLEDGKYRF